MASGRRPPSVAVARDLIRQQTGRCGYCNWSLADRTLEWDHFVPFSFTGTNLPDNWVAACHLCNRSKASKHLTTEEAIYDFCFDMLVRHGDRSEGWPEGASEAWPWLND